MAVMLHWPVVTGGNVGVGSFEGVRFGAWVAMNFMRSAMLGRSGCIADIEAASATLKRSVTSNALPNRFVMLHVYRIRGRANKCLANLKSRGWNGEYPTSRRLFPGALLVF